MVEISLNEVANVLGKIFDQTDLERGYSNFWNWKGCHPIEHPKLIHI